MAYDIYGNDLRRGFCEVHPFVQQEYPCHICCDNDRHYEQQRVERQSQEQEWNLALEHHHKCLMAEEFSRRYRLLLIAEKWLNRLLEIVKSNKTKIENQKG